MLWHTCYFRFEREKRVINCSFSDKERCLVFYVLTGVCLSPGASGRVMANGVKQRGSPHVCFFLMCLFSFYNGEGFHRVWFAGYAKKIKSYELKGNTWMSVVRVSYGNLRVVIKHVVVRGVL
jgi:hypothetical protein